MGAQYQPTNANYLAFLTAQEAYAFAAGVIYKECEQEGRVYQGTALMHAPNGTIVKCAGTNAEYFYVTFDNKEARLHSIP